MGRWSTAGTPGVLASGGGDPLAVGEAARNLAVLARKAGWHEQASSIALAAAASPLLADPGPRLAAERGLLIQSAAYTAARAWYIARCSWRSSRACRRTRSSALLAGWLASTSV